jgi:hypothetical protein
MGMRRMLAVASCIAAVVGVGAGSAFAGEITGNGKPLWTNTTDPNVPHTLHGNSECAFSGQNDNFVLGHPVPDEDGFTRTQSWGQVGQEGRAFLTSIGLNPGIACNPSKAG